MVIATAAVLLAILPARSADARQGTFRISISYQGTPANSASTNPAISKDGRYVAFVTTLPTNIAPPGQEYGNIFVLDRNTSQYWQPRPLPRLYISSTGDQGVHAFHIIDKGSLVEFASVGVGAGAGAMATMAPASVPHVFVANKAAGSLSTVVTWGMYSLPEEEIILGAPGVSVPSAIDVDYVLPRLYVADEAQGRIVYVNPKIPGSPLAVEGAVNVGSQPSAVLLCVPKAQCRTTYDRRKLFVANRGSNTVSFVDPYLGAVTQTVPVGQEPEALQFTGARLYVANRGSDSVSVISPNAQPVTEIFLPAGSTPVDLAFVNLGGGRLRVFTADSGLGSVSVISDVAAPALVGTVSVPGSPIDVEADPQLRVVYVISQVGTAGALTTIDAETLGVISTQPLGFVPTRATFSTPPLQLPSNFTGSEPSLSRGGRYLVFTYPTSRRVYIYDNLYRSLEFADITSVTEPLNPFRPSTASSNNPVVSDDGRYVAFVSTASNLLPGAELDDTNNVADVFLADRTKSIFRVERVSLTTVNGEANGASDGRIAISGNGRFIAFSSVADNLVPNDLNARRDVFVRDRGTDVDPPDTRRASISSTQVEGNNVSDWPSISDDGRYVAFQSTANNLVAGDTNNQSDVFVRDFLLAVTDRASVSTIGVQASGASNKPSIAADGRAVAFSSTAANLVPLDWNGFRDIFIRDRIERRTYMASRTTFGGQSAGGNSDNPAIAEDGLTVAFDSLANNLVTEPDDSNNKSDVFVRKIDSMPERMSADFFGNQGATDANRPSVSRDGRFVAFHSRHPFDSNDTNNEADVYVRDRFTDTLERVSVTNTGAEPNGRSTFAAMSGDGRYVAFVSTATNLITETIDDNGQTDIYVRDRIARRTYLVSQNDAGEISRGGPSRFPAISDSGRFIAFQSSATNLVPGDTNNQWDIFLRDQVLNTTIRISVKSDGSQCSQAPFPASTRPAISTGGGFVVFHSWCKDLVDSSSPGGADTNNVADVYLRDWMNSITERVSLTNTGGQANGPSQFPTISSNGRYIAFHSTATNLVADDTNGKRDVFVRDRVAGKTYRASVNSAGQQVYKDSGYASIAPNDTRGYFVVFHSEATDLVPPGIDTNNVRDCYARWVPSSATYGVAATWRVATKRPGFESSDSLQYNNWSGTCISSRDASPVVFQTAATDVTPPQIDTNGSTIDIYGVEA